MNRDGRRRGLFQPSSLLRDFSRGVQPRLVRGRLRLPHRRLQHGPFSVEFTAKTGGFSGKVVGGSRGGRGDFNLGTLPRGGCRGCRSFPGTREVGHLQLQLRDPRAQTQNLLPGLVRLVGLMRQLGGERLGGIFGSRRRPTRLSSVAGDKRLDACLGHLERLLELRGVTRGGVGAAPVRGERGEQRPFGEFTRAQFARHPREFGAGFVFVLSLSVADERANHLFLQVGFEVPHGVRRGG